MTWIRNLQDSCTAIFPCNSSCVADTLDPSTRVGPKNSTERTCPMKHRPSATLLLVIFAVLAVSIVATVCAQDVARKADLEGVVVSSHFLAGVSAPPIQERCSVPSQAPPDTCECGPNNTKVSNPCIYCSTPSGKNCGKKCQSCYVVCDPKNSVPGQSPACG